MRTSLAIIVLATWTATEVVAASSASFDIPTHTISWSKASTHVGSSSFNVSHTVAQPSPAGSTPGSASFTLVPGFQATIGPGSSAPPITDTDADGMDDGWETSFFGDLSHSASEDFDHDGLSNYLEFILGQDPTSRGAPAWWATRSTLNGAALTNDYSALNQGQLKSIATLAAQEMNAVYTGGPGTAVSNLVNTFSLNNNYKSVNLGQLKWVAKPYYDRLMSKGQSDTYPWTGAIQTNDYSTANSGMAKHIFSFPIIN